MRAQIRISCLLISVAGSLVAVGAVASFFLFSMYSSEPLPPIAKTVGAGSGNTPSQDSFPADKHRTLHLDRTLAAAANRSILFIGNSHTLSHRIPELVSDLIRFRNSQGPVYASSIGTSFLEQAAGDQAVLDELQSGAWDIVVLQAQKISSSGQYHYSTAEGTALANHAKDAGAKVFFFAEWGVRNSDDSAERTDQVYRGMAKECDATIIPVGRAWTAALHDAPTLEMYAADGNHESRLGASLTALIIASFVLNESPLAFRDYPDPAASAADWKLFCAKAEQVWQAERTGNLP